MNQAIDTSAGSVRVGATAKAPRIPDCSRLTAAGLTPAQISRFLDMPKSTLLNQIHTPEEAGFLFKPCGSRSYRLGDQLMEPAHLFPAIRPGCEA